MIEVLPTSGSLFLRVFLPLVLACSATVTFSQQVEAGPVQLPDAPSRTLTVNEVSSSSSSMAAVAVLPEYRLFADLDGQSGSAAQAARESDPRKPVVQGDVDAEGKPIPLERQQPKRILGFMPNFRTVSGGAVPPKPSFRYNFKVATRQAFDYSSFLFLGITSLSAEGINSHPVLGKGIGGLYAYTWRGFLDKTDGTYLAAWLLPSILHEDTRFYALGRGPVVKRVLYVISRQGVTRTYGGRDTPNIAGLGGKVLTQVISREYYPTGATDFGVLATKFGYSVMRDIAFSSIREFYPTIAAHYIRKHREKMALQMGRP